MVRVADRVTLGPQSTSTDAVLVVIGDLINSRAVADRQGLQRRFVAATERCNQTRTGLLSPYTVTLGDEFQAVLANGQRVFQDLTAIAAELRGAPDAVPPDPAAASIRFSLCVGTLATPVNPTQAIAMDGPAFHAAREGIEQLKKSGEVFTLHGLAPDTNELCNSAFGLVSHVMSGWSPRRHWILAERMRRTEVATLAERVGVSAAAVYKNLTHGGVDVVCRNLLAIAALIDGAMPPRRE